jgi:hypothetical protein
VLLPHERWFANKAIRNTDAPEGSARWRMWQTYGPQGAPLRLAGAIDLFLGLILGMVGVILITVSEGEGTLGYTGYVIAIAGMAIILFAGVRFGQGTRAGRKFQSG